MADKSFFRISLSRLILFTFLVRCGIACLVHLGNDEAYYFTYALQPDWNHFDHPPLVGVFIRLFTLNMHWVNDFSMRLTSIGSAAVCTWLIAQCGRLIRNEQTGLIAAILYSTSLYTSIIAGVFIIPDSPQLVFWLAALYSMLRIIQHSEKDKPGSFILWTGLWIGLACMSKIHGIFLWFGFGAYILAYDRKWLRNPYLYLSVLITICIIFPILFWNMNNHFITWRFHSERVAIKNGGLNISAFATMLAGQFIYNNPVNVILAIMALLSLRQQPHFLRSKYKRLLLWCSLPLIIVATGISLFRSTLPHWSGPGFTGLMLLTAAFIDGRIAENRGTRYRRLITSSIAFIIFSVVAGIGIVHFYPGTLGKKNPPETGKGDTTLDMYGWDGLRQAFSHLRNADIQKGIMTGNTPLLVNKWFPAGHLCFYVAYPERIPIVGEGNLDDLHKFVWLNQQQGYIDPGGDAYFIAPSNYFTDPSLIYQNDFQSISLAVKLPQTRSGRIARYWNIYRLKGAKRQLGTRLLP